jgi:tetratricopeptide (TPR) repeat protein
MRIPHPPLPERPHGTEYFLATREYLRALEHFDDLIRQYPDLYGAHNGRASILATCPDTELRDGDKAVASATRACALTSWQNPDVLSTLAAAHAEAGDFAKAIGYEQKAQDLYAKIWHTQGNFRPEQMAAYQAGNPYHDAR